MHVFTSRVATVSVIALYLLIYHHSALEMLLNLFDMEEIKLYLIPNGKNYYSIKKK